MKKLIFCLTLLYLSISSWSQEMDLMTSLDENEAPLDGVVEYTNLEAKALKYPPVRAADILWEKRIWRELDTREKINHPFRYEKKPFFSVLMEGIRSGALEAYSPETDQFSMPLSVDELSMTMNERDTVMITDPVTGEDRWQIISNDFDPLTVMRYRIKEVWFFDTRYSQMRVRILGIAPIISEYDDNGNLRFERPLFWIYYPDARDYLAKQPVFSPYNNKQTMSWEDWLEMRFFSSYITKESDIHDRRLQDYLSGEDLLQKSEKIKMEIFNYEQDMWSY